MGGFSRLRAWSARCRSTGERGLTLVELLVTIVILGVLGSVTSVALAGFDDASSAIACPADTSRLKRAESTFFRQQARYGSEADLVGAGLLEVASDVHDITAASMSYSISEVGRCVGSNTTYSLSAPTVGSTEQSGATVAVMNPDGTAVSGAAVSYSQGSWTAIGTTGVSGQVNAPLADGTYDFRVVLNGTTNTLSAVTVTQGTLVTFPTVQLTVSLTNSTGAPLSGGAVSILSSGGSASSIGTTGAAGSVTTQVLPAVYDVTMTYASRSMVKTGISVNAASTVSFQTHALTVRLLSSGGGAPLAGGVVSATPSGGSPIALGTTSAAGTVVATLLDGGYTVSMTYNGTTTTQSATLSSDTTLTFTAPGSVTATLQMLSSTGSGLTGQDAAIWWRAAGASSWTFAGYPNASGAVSFTANAGNYDFRARWFGTYDIKTNVAISSGTAVTFQAVAVTEFLRSSTGTGLTGQDSAIWLRPSGTSSWYFSGYPNASGQVVQQLLNGNYDFRARWFGVLEVSPSTAVSSATTVTFQAVAVTEFLRSSTGTGLTGQDSAIWLRRSGTSSWYFSGYPNASGQVVQQLLNGNYDFRARWFGTYDIKTNIAISAATTVTFQAVAVTEFLRSSTGTGLTGQDSAIWLRPSGTSSWYFSGYPNASGQVVQQLLNGNYDFRARWLGVLEVSPSTAITAATTVTFQAASIDITALRTSDNSVVSGATVSIITGGGTYNVGSTDGTGKFLAQVLVGTVGVRCTRSPITGTNSNIVVPAGGTSTTVMLA